ncbi:hypothetical protein PRZ48_011449 [Zasmidium cellare]|uniref:Uncharacterized protein n=1 Tax=Zasmidium cellare TaxID=395010 RepID=A0ABR0E6D6_ZASCE|nr:hypothetical protein PRZ48_011449 [Zasmidium cellare]
MSDTDHVLPSPEALERSRAKLLSLSQQGLGLDRTKQHLQDDIVPGLNRSSQSPNFYGFVTGGATPAAAHADNLVTLHDQNTAVHLPTDTIATDVEDAALRMLLELFRLPETSWKHRILTTGATASNILGMACGREYAVQQVGKRKGLDVSVGELGLLEACNKAGVEKVRVLTTVPHSSLAKAASVVGLGRASLVEVGMSQGRHHFDFQLLEEKLREGAGKTAFIVAVSCAEVNTGFFATSGTDMQRLRDLCDRYGAWLHVDAAFGLQARVLSPDELTYSAIVDGTRGIELADSITGDAHKLLNVPYDCGIFLSRHLTLATQVFQNAGAAYLNTSAADIPSPLNIGIENSRRFRALPVYATLTAHGREGYQDILHRQIDLSRAIANFISQTPGYELLPRLPPSFDKPKEQGLSRIYMVVLFRATDDSLNRELVKRINATRKIFVSGTQWDGQPAARFAVSNWQVDVERDLELIKSVLTEVLSGSK